MVVDGDKYTTSKITKRSNLINGIVDHLHFAHLDLWDTTGEVKNGALIFINTNGRCGSRRSCATAPQEHHGCG